MWAHWTVNTCQTMFADVSHEQVLLDILTVEEPCIQLQIFCNKNEFCKQHKSYHVSTVATKTKHSQSSELTSREPVNCCNKNKAFTVQWAQLLPCCTQQCKSDNLLPVVRSLETCHSTKLSPCTPQQLVNYPLWCKKGHFSFDLTVNYLPVPPQWNSLKWSKLSWVHTKVHRGEHVSLLDCECFVFIATPHWFCIGHVSSCEKKQQKFGISKIFWILKWSSIARCTWQCNPNFVLGLFCSEIRLEMDSNEMAVKNCVFRD